jgi:hypothetical protein
MRFNFGRLTANVLGAGAILGSIGWMWVSLRTPIRRKQRWSAVTGPLGLVQLFAGILLLCWSTGASSGVLYAVGAGVFVSYVIWISTLFLGRSSGRLLK